MKNPGLPAGSASCSDDSAGTGSPLFWNCLCTGCGTGHDLRLSAPAAAQIYSPGGHSFCVGSLPDVAGAGVSDLRRGFAAGLCRRSGGRGISVGKDRRQGLTASMYVFWENSGRFLENNMDAPEKIFKKSENFVCICGKMGYNKME